MKRIILFFVCIISWLLPIGAEQYSVFKSGKKYGLIDSQLKIVIPAENQNICFSDNYILVINSATSVKVYEKNLKQGQTLTFSSNELIYDIYFLYDDLFYIMFKTKKEGILFNAATGISIPTTLVTNGLVQDSGVFDKYLPVIQQNKRGYITENGGFISCSDFELLYPYVESRAVIVKEDENSFQWEYRIIDEQGKSICELKDCGNHFREGFLAAKLMSGETGFISSKGTVKFLCPMVSNGERTTMAPSLKYYFSEGYVYVQIRKGVWQVFDKKGNTVSEELPYYPGTAFRRTNGFTYGLLNVTDPKTGLSGFINPKGETVIPFLYTSVQNFYNGFAIVQKDGVDGVINNKGKFTAVTDFSY
ncbi:MAG: WG repeat-containing protein [Treponema sp.]|nr:WG repeat-containing protein [Treponema sp.]